jgi:ubiquinone biosynthesis protein UbiJ
VNWSPELLLALGGIVANAAITYGVVATRVEWVRADVARLQARLDRMESRWSDLR